MNFVYKKTITNCKDCPYMIFEEDDMGPWNLWLCSAIKNQPVIPDIGIRSDCPYDKKENNKETE